MGKQMGMVAKLSLSFGTVVLLLVTTIVVALNSMASMDEITRDITDDRYPKIDVSGNMQVAMLDVGRNLRNALLVGTDEEADKVKARIQKLRGTVNDGLTISRDGKGNGFATLVFRRLALLKGQYTLNVFLFCERAVHTYDYAVEYGRLDVSQRGLEQGFVSLPHEWRGPNQADRPATREVRVAGGRGRP